jgi:hypothetical protein
MLAGVTVMATPRDRTKRQLQRLLAIAATSVAPACSTGYGVVDPLPPPPRCQGAAASIRATAVLIAGDLVEVRLEKPTMAGVTYSTQRPASVESFVVTDNTVVFTVKRAPVVSTAVGIACGSLSNVNVSIEVPAAAKEGNSVFVTLSDGM